MIDERATTMNDSTQSPESTLANPPLDVESANVSRRLSQFDEGTWNFDAPSEPTAQADRRNARRKLAAGGRGLKSAIRGDSSFFAHGYRGTLIAITAALLGVNQWSWCLLVIAACLVLIAELAHSAVDTLARAIGDPEEPRLRTAREIAAAGVLVSAFGSGIVTTIVLFWKFAELLRWRP
jgi:diacylglycerol kinase